MSETGIVSKATNRAVTSSQGVAEEILGKQSKVVAALRTIIEKKTVHFVDKKTGKVSKHIEAIAWQSIAAVFGVMPKIIACEEDENGMKAVCQLTRFATNELVGEMSAYVGRDEKQWYGGAMRGKDGRPYELPKKPMNQIRSCAQTRAIRQAIKVALGHVAILLESFGVDPHQSAEERELDEREETTEALPAPVTELQWNLIKEKKALAGLSSEKMVELFGRSELLNEETAAAVIAQLDGIIASREGGKEG